MSRIKMKSYRISISERKGKPEKPIRIAVISDLHNRRFGEGNNKLASAILGQYPDLIFCIGDMTVCKPGRETKLEVGISLLKRLACECPVYCVNGNHEFRSKIYPETYPNIYSKWVNGLKRGGVILLEDDKTEIACKGTTLVLHGLELPIKYYKKRRADFMSAEEIRDHIGEPEEDRYNILLAHNPDFFESYALWGADLTLSGHLHGGSVRLPFAGGVISPQLKLFPKYDYGLYEKYAHKMVVTSGLGTHSIAMRINNPPEVVILELY
ncbi:MAG: metallophosphoesterase [Eubacteriales bacterium]|nr:metallophosphoesterase [Eubacteriales bacterium]